MPPRVSVIGAAGFGGALAARLLYAHPSFDLVAVTARSDVGRRLDDLYPHYRVPLMLEELDLDRHAEVDAAVVAYPHGAAAPVDIAESDTQVAEFQDDVYSAIANVASLQNQLKGLLLANPADPLWTANLVPVSTAMPAIPEPKIADVVIDAKSGVSGAGRTATEKTHFVTVDENVSAYGVPRHRHTPEIEQELAALGAEVRITFTPHLVPLDQGELVSCYVTVASEIGAGELGELYADAYGDEPFVELAARPPGVRDVRESNFCRISVHLDGRTGRAIVFAAIDNLWKGAASQAVQNLNLMFGLPEGEGIS